MSLVYTVLTGFALAIIWVLYRFAYKREKIKDGHLLNFFAVVFLGSIMFYSCEMLYYGATGSFLFAETTIETMREPMGLGGLILLAIGIYVFWKELSGEIKEEAVK